MFLLSFYRFYAAILIASIVYMFLSHSLLALFVTAVVVRTIWFFIERAVINWQRNIWFNQHAFNFKQQLGPYGIRMINKAQADKTVKKSLSEVFVPNLNKLQKTVEQLEMMDALFKAGMRPDADSYQLHDLKLKYGKFRLEQQSPKKQ